MEAPSEASCRDRPPPATDLLDLGALAEIEALFGPLRLRVLLAELRAEIAARLLPEGLGAEALSRGAHDLAGSSGTLGLTALARACAEVTAAVGAGCREGLALDGLRQRLQETAGLSLAALARFDARLG